MVVGQTDMDPQEVQEVVQQLGTEYRGNAYHLLERNCNHFSDELAFKLTGNHAPPWVSILTSTRTFDMPALVHLCLRLVIESHSASIVQYRIVLM